MSVIDTLKGLYYRRNSDSYISYLRSQGIKIGDNCVFRAPNSVRIDVSRPSLVSIGNNVDMNKNFQIMTHDWASMVFRAKFHDLINSSGAVKIGSNVYFGTDVVVLKGVSIGDNCVIGAGSVVSKNIPSNSVAAGVPCKVICSINDYYEKRKTTAFNEAIEYIRSIFERFGRRPYLSEMREEFIYFVNAENVIDYEKKGVPIRFQLGDAYNDWLKVHQTSMFKNFDEFVDYALGEREDTIDCLNDKQ